MHIFEVHSNESACRKSGRLGLEQVIRGREGGYDYTRTHTNDVLVVVVNPTSIFNNLNETYKMKTFGPPKIHIVCD